MNVQRAKSTRTREGEVEKAWDRAGFQKVLGIIINLFKGQESMAHWHYACMLSCIPLFCDPMDCSLPGSSVHGIFQANRMSFHFLLHGIIPSQGSNPDLHWRQILDHWTTWETSCVVLTAFTLLCGHHHHPSPELLSSWQLKPHAQ